MARPRRPKPDQNQRQLIREARQIGIVVWNTSSLGGKILDALMCWRGVCLPIEIKAPGCEADLTPGEEQGIAELNRVGVQAVVATCLEDILSAFNDFTT